MNAGEEVIARLRNHELQVDDAWSLDTPGGFIWWPSTCAQAIELVGGGSGPDEPDGYCIRVKTEVLREVELNDRTCRALAALMSQATMAGLVYDPNTSAISLCSHVRVNEESGNWMAGLLRVAAMLQIQEAGLVGPSLAASTGSIAAGSAHPTSGPRSSPDKRIADFQGTLAEIGTAPCKWPIHEFNQALNEFMQSPPALSAAGGFRGISVEFPFGGLSSLCHFDGDDAHSRIGHGLALKQKFPNHNLQEIEATEVALYLNLIELDQRPSGYGFGSYCHEDGCVCFKCFIPNLAYKPGLIPNFYFSCAERARFMSARFTDNDWGEMQGSGTAHPVGVLQKLLQFLNLG